MYLYSYYTELMGNRMNQSRKNAGEVLYKTRPLEQVVKKLKNESQGQYEVFKLYCEANSLVALRAKLDTVPINEQAPLLTRRGGLPYRRTLDRWSRRFRWVKRKEKWTREQCKEIYSWFTDQRHNNPSFLMTVKLHRGYTKATPKNGGEDIPTLFQDYPRNGGKTTATLRQNDGGKGIKGGQKKDENKEGKSL